MSTCKSASASVFEAIRKGKEGKNIGIPTTLEKFDSTVYGVQRESLITIFADSGGGKTTFALFAYVYKPLIAALQKTHKIKILFFSFEMSKTAVLTKLLCLHAFYEFGVVITYKEALSLTEEISDEKLEILEKCQGWLEEASSLIDIREVPITPNDIDNELRTWCSKFGKFIDLGNHEEAYLEDDPELFKIVVIDHIRLTKGNGKGVKSTIDEACDKFIYYRNKCKITGVIVQQANRNSKGMDRKSSGYNMFQLDDTSDSSGPTQASEVVVGLYYPYREKIGKVDGYNVKILKHRIRICQILKNRYGDCDLNVGFGFFGEIGLFKELPKAEDIVDYEDYLHLTPKNTEVVKPQKVEKQGVYFSL